MDSGDHMQTQISEDFMPAVLHVRQVILTLSGLPWSGKNIWKMKFFPDQGKVREFCRWPEKFRKDLESQGM